MLRDFNNNIFIGNVYFQLNTNKSVKIGELEDKAGVSKGYFARLKKDNTAKPSIDVVMKVADMFHVSIDSLVGIEMGKLSATDQYKIKFLEKLRTDTESEKLDWGRETAAELGNLRLDEDGNPSHPFFRRESCPVWRGGDYPEYYESNVFVSEAFGLETAINGDCFYLHMKGAILFLADIVKEEHRSNDPDAYAKEIWLQTWDKSNQFLCSSKDPAFTSYVNNLFSTVAAYCRRPKLSQECRNVIDNFLES